jgi:uncharacterized MAPEG superfamily protein
MTIAYYCVLFMGLLPIVAAGIAKKGFKDFDNSMPRQWLEPMQPRPIFLNPFPSFLQQ